MPALFLHSLGLSDRIAGEAGPPPKLPQKEDHKEEENDDDSLWEGVAPNSDCSAFFICGTAVPDNEYEHDADEDFTAPITNRGTIGKSDTPTKESNDHDDEATLGSLASGSSSSSSSSSSDSSESSDESASLRLLCEHIEEVQPEINCDGEESIFDGIILNENEKTRNATTTAPSARIENGSARDIVASIVENGPVEENRSSRDELREGISLSSSSDVEKQGESRKSGLSFREKRGLFATMGKDRRSKKNSSRRFLGFGRSSRKVTSPRTSETEQLPTSFTIVVHEHHQSDAREEAPRNEYENNHVLLLNERMVLKPDYRGRLIKQSNLEELIRSIDPKDRRNRVLSASDGSFEIVRPSRPF